MSLKIIKAKPNPAGKDRIGRTLTPRSQLAGEWIDIQNVSKVPLSLGSVELYHFAYNVYGAGNWRLVTDFNGVLQAGQIMRVHSGSPIPLSQMHQIDVVGAHYHLFSNKNYVWNNSKKDYPRLWSTAHRGWIDITYYDAFPIEGKILIRIGDKLI